MCTTISKRPGVFCLKKADDAGAHALNLHMFAGFLFWGMIYGREVILRGFGGEFLVNFFCIFKAWH